MIVAPGGDGGLGVGPVTVTADQSLMAAQPDMMVAAAASYEGAAHTVNSVARATTRVADQLVADWKGKGALDFHGHMNDLTIDAPTAAESLIGTAGALRTLAGRITEAQGLARQAMALAGQTTQASRALDAGYADATARNLAALPADATADQVAHASAPSPAQQAQANQLAADALQATQLMNQANALARQAWQAATAAFDVVTANAPSVQNAALDARIKVFTKNIDSMGTAVLFTAMAAAATGVPPGDAEEEPPADVVSRAATDDPYLAADISAEEKLTVDGEHVDPALAADIEDAVPLGYSDYDSFTSALNKARLNETTAPLLRDADPLGGMTPAEYQKEYWDPTAKTSHGPGAWRYPPNNGADPASPSRTVTFNQGDTFDRFGQPSGNFASPVGTPWGQRSLPPTNLLPSGNGEGPYYVYEVTAKWANDPPPVTVTQSKVAPAFGQPGGGIQYNFEGKNIEWLIQHGYLEEIK